MARPHSLRPLVRRIANDTRGATAVEYGFILAMIVLAMMVALHAVAEGTLGLWTNMSTRVGSASSAASAPAP